MAATSERDEVFWSYERGYREAQELFDEDKLIEAMEKADELLSDNGITRYHRIKCYILIASATDDAEEASDLVRKAETLWHMSRACIGGRRGEDDPDAEEALAELRSDLDLLKDAQRRSEMDATDAILAAEIEDSECEQKLQEMDLEETEDEERTADKTGLPEAVDEVKQPGVTDMDMDVKHPGQPEDTGPELKQPENKQPVHNMPVCEMPVCEMPEVKQPELKQLGGKMPVYKMPEITQPEPNLLKRESAEDIKAVQSDTEMAGGEDQGHPPLLHHRSKYATLPRRKKPHASGSTAKAFQPFIDPRIKKE